MKKCIGNYFVTQIHLFQEEALHFTASYFPYLLKYVGVKRHPSNRDFFQLTLNKFLNESSKELEKSKYSGVREFMISSNLLNKIEEQL